jgi:nicotinamidase-related amidase
VAEVAVLYALHAATEAGYRVFVPVDASGGTSTRTENAAFRPIVTDVIAAPSLPSARIIG